MKPSLALSLVLALSATIPAVGQAQSGGMKDMDMKGTESGKAQGTVHKGVGVVKKVDGARSAVTLDHEAIRSLNWAAMTMTFAVKDKKLLDKLKTGNKVEFEFVQQGKENMITSVK